MTFPFLFRRGWFALLIVGICLAEKAQAADPLSADVVIVANADDPDSVSLAHFYAQKRQIPEKNIILLYATGDETVTWHAFVELIWRPLQEELFKRGWLRGIPSFLYDHYGRKKYGITGHHISYLVVCKGLPLRISEDPSLIDPTDMEKIRPEMRITCAAVDSELSLLAQNNTSPVGYIGNPLYQRKTPTAAESERVVKVARLDGPSYVAARGLINSALAAEKNGLDGRYYIDEGGPHPEGNAWLASVRAQLEQLGFDGDTESTTGTIQQTARFDAPVLYFGWYAPDLTGPMVLPGFHFPSGAIALHIHSYSAVTLRSDQKGWCGPLVARGVTATFGNVYEPFLEFTHRPSLIVEALIAGKNLGDAAYYAMPVLSWQSIVVGDPLYRPFPKQSGAISSSSSPPGPYAPYAALREAKLLSAKGNDGKAVAVLRRTLQEIPNLALVVELAHRSKAKGNREEYLRLLQIASTLTQFRPDELGLITQVAAELTEAGLSVPASAIYENLLATVALTPEFENFLRARRAEIEASK